MDDFTHTHRYVVLSCAECKVTFGVTEEHFKQLKASGEAFYCPSGHGNVFASKPATEQDNRDQGDREQTIRELKGQLTHTKDALYKMSNRAYQAEQRANLEGSTELPDGFPSRFYLYSAGIYTYQQLDRKDDDELLELRGLGQARLETIRAEAKAYWDALEAADIAACAEQEAQEYETA